MSKTLQATDASQQTDSAAPQAPIRGTSSTPASRESPENTSKETTAEKSLSSEAARYRVKLRDTETQLQQAQEQNAQKDKIVTALQRSAIETIAVALNDPSDLWRYGGEDHTELLDDSGLPVPEKIQRVVDQITTERPYLRKGYGNPRPDPTQGAKPFDFQKPRSTDPLASFFRRE